MTAEFHIWLIYGLAAAGAVFLTILAANLALAPYRLAKGRAEALEKENQEIRGRADALAAEKVTPLLELELEGVHFGGTSIHNIDGHIQIIVYIKVSNVGGVQSICKNWNLLLLTPDGEEIPSKFAYYDWIEMQDNEGNKSHITRDDWIFIKAESPVQPGGITRGAAIIAAPIAPPESYKGYGIAVSCEDFRGRQTEARYSIKGIATPNMYVPTLKRGGYQPN